MHGLGAPHLQWTNDNPDPNWSNHYVAFHRPEAIHATMRFLETGVFDGTPVIERAPNSGDR